MPVRARTILTVAWAVAAMAATVPAVAAAAPVAPGRPAGSTVATSTPRHTGHHPYSWRDLATVPSAPAVTPDFPQATLRIAATFPAGAKPYRTAAIVVNTDDSRRYAQIVALTRDLRLSVPTGHYAVMAIATYLTFDGSGPDANVTSVVDRIAFALDQDVTAAGGTASVDLTKATATGLSPTYRVPQPSRFDVQATYLYLGDQHHQDAGLSYEVDTFAGDDQPPYQAFVQPVSGTAPGLTTADHTIYTADGSAYRPATVYQLATYHPNALVLGEHVAVAPQNVATMNSTVYTDEPGRYAILDWAPNYPAFDPGEGFDFRLPESATTRVDYLGGAPLVRWESHFEVDSDSGAIGGFGFPRTFTPGQTYDADFLRGPLAPGIGNGSLVVPYSPASRTGDHLAVGLAPVVDTDRTHFAYVFPANAPDHGPAPTRTRIYQDGRQVFDGTNYTQPVPILIAGGTQAVIAAPAEAHLYRVVDTLDLAQAGFTLSTRAVSDYRFTSSATSGAAVPKATCAAPGGGTCTALPLLTLSVPLPTSDVDTLPAGTATFDVTVGHIDGGRPDPITALTFATSLDGTHFTTAPVAALGGGRYRVTLATPVSASGHTVTTRVSATDAAGSSLTQTVTAAFRVG